MLDARQYNVKEILRNGLEISIRAARPDDSERVVAAFHELAPESIYTRFFGPKKELSESDLRTFREVDFNNRVILLGTVMREGGEIVIASASYVRSTAGTAEIAFIVEEDYHTLGIARRLLQHLANIATDAGIHSFVAEVLPYNNAMLGVFGRCGWPMESKTTDGTVHVRLALSEA